MKPGLGLELSCSPPSRARWTAVFLEIMDAETVNLILELQLQDVRDLLSSRKGKQREGDVPDYEIALQIQEAEFANVFTVLSDRRMCQSISRAIQDDGAALSLARHEERIATRDHNLALSLSGRNVPTPVESTAKATPLTEALLSRLSSMNITSADDDVSSIVTYSDLDGGEGSSKGVKKRGPSPSTYECSSCFEKFPSHEVFVTKCEHSYCHPCLTQLFELSMVDESLFPPRCCGLPIALSAVQGIVGSQLIRQAEKKDVERATLDRVYCSNPSCSTFILPEDIDGNNVTCSECQGVTCVECKKSAHSGNCVLVDEDREQVLRMAAENCWKTCPRCHNLIELRQGCNHIT